MFELFTAGSRKVCAFANEEAQKLNHEYIGTEHLLLGILRMKGCQGLKIMSSYNIKLEKIKNS